MARKPKLGTGARFRRLKSSLGGDVKDPGAVAAAIGRRKFGATRFAKLGAKGRHRAAIRRARSGG